MEDKFVKLDETCDWSGYTFVFACVSVGNVAQLTTDLLISSLVNTQKAGYVLSTCAKPIVGYDAYINKSYQLSTSFEIYENKSLKLVILQQRAPLLKDKKSTFLNLLIDFIKSQKFHEVICLTSACAYERSDSQLVGHQCRFVAANTESAEFNHLREKLNWQVLEPRFAAQEMGTSGDIFIPGAGLAKKFLEKSKENKINAYVLSIFAHEGNNIPEAIELVKYLNEWKNYMTTPPLKTPISWKYLFGNNYDVNPSQIF